VHRSKFIHFMLKSATNHIVPSCTGSCRSTPLIGPALSRHDQVHAKEAQQKGQGEQLSSTHSDILQCSGEAPQRESTRQPGRLLCCSPGAPSPRTGEGLRQALVWFQERRREIYDQDQEVYPQERCEGWMVAAFT
jgi:hypothetical protein